MDLQCYDLVPTKFLLKYIMRSLLAKLTPLHLEDVDLKRNGELSKMGLLPICLYTFTINRATTGAQKCLLSICFALFVANLSRKKCGLLNSVFKKIISNNTTPTFQEVGGVT